MKTAILKISDIVVDERLYPRNRVNESIVQEYAKDMERGNKFPNIFIGLYKRKNYLIDGKHRLGAYEIYLPADNQYVQCDIKTNFPDFESMLLAAVKANINHGLRLTESDKLKVAHQLKDMKFDTEDIGKLVGINVKKFESLIVHKESQIIFRSKVAKGELPSKITEKIEKGEEVSIVDEKKLKEIQKSSKDEYDAIELQEIYRYLKKGKFNINNPKIKSIILKIKKLFKKVK